MKKLLDALQKFCKHRESLLKQPLLLLIVGSLIIWGIQQKVLIHVNRQEKRLDRKYYILTRTPQLCSDCYQKIWNLWHGVENKEPQENRIKYREELQSIFAEANSISAELPILFKDERIAKDWEALWKIYQHAEYPITRDGITQADLNKKIDEAEAYISNIVKNISEELK